MILRKRWVWIGIAVIVALAMVSMDAAPISAFLSARVGARATALAYAATAAPAGALAAAASTGAAPAASTAGPLLPLDFGAIFDNLQYQLLGVLAGLLWMPHGALQSIASILHAVSSVLTNNLLQTVLDLLIEMLNTTGVVRIAATLALLIAGITLLASYVPIRVVEIGKIIGYGIAVALLLSQGPQVMVQIEQWRRDTADRIYQEVYDTTRTQSGAWASILAFPAVEDWQRFQLQSSGGGISARDVAASALECAPGEVLKIAICNDFRNTFFPHTSIRHLNEGARNQALQRGSQALNRLVTIFPLTAAALLESVMELLFAVAGFLLLVSIVLSVVFVFFLPTEGITMGLVRRYISVVVLYLVISVFTGVGMAMLAAAAGMGGLPRVVAVSAIASLLYWAGISMAGSSVKQASTAFYDGIVQAAGAGDPLRSGGKLVRGAATAAAGVGLAATGGGLLAGASLMNIGANQMADGLGGSSSSRSAGLMRAAGGLMLGGAANRLGVGGAVRSAATLQAVSDGDNVLDTFSQASLAESVLVGASARGGNPLSTVLALDRSVRRGQRWRGTEQPPRAQEGRDPTSAEAPAHEQGVPEPRRRAPLGYHSETSPWRKDIDRAIAMLGNAWATQVADALVTSVETYRSAGMTDADIQERFANAAGQVSLTSPGVRDLLAVLPKDAQMPLRTREAQQGLRGIIGEGIMGRTGLSRDDLAYAIAQTMREGGFAAGAPADAVARTLGTTGPALGPAYSSINAVARAAHRSGLSPDEVEVSLRGQRGVAGSESLLAVGRMLPEQMHIIQDSVAPTSRDEEERLA